MKKKIVFSERLIEKYKAVFEKRAKREIGDEEAEMHLHKLAGMGFLVQKSYLQGKRGIEIQKQYE